MVISSVCLVPVRLLLFSMAVLYHVNGYHLQRAYSGCVNTPLHHPLTGSWYSCLRASSPFEGCREKSRARITRKKRREREAGRESLPSWLFRSPARVLSRLTLLATQRACSQGIKLSERGSATFYSLVWTSFAGNPTLLDSLRVFWRENWIYK